MVGDDGAPCRNGWQAYGLHMTGTAAATAETAAATAETAATGTRVNGTDAGGGGGGGGPSSNATRRTSSGGRAKNGGNKRQAVFESDPDDPTTAAPKPFQWLTKGFAFVKRMFTFVIIPFFKFVRNTFFQTRSLDDTVVDVSETHLTVSEVKYSPPPTPPPAPTTTTTTAATASTTGAATDSSDSVDGRSADGGRVDGDDKRRPSSSKRETGVVGDDRCGGGGGARPDDDRVTAADLLEATAAADHALPANADRYLRMVSDGLNDVGVHVAFVRRAFACCAGPVEPRSGAALIDWDRTRARAHNVTVTAHACGRRS